MNAEILAILNTSANAMASAAMSAETCYRAANPAWDEAARLLADCADELRELMIKLGGTISLEDYPA